MKQIVENIKTFLIFILNNLNTFFEYYIPKG